MRKLLLALIVGLLFPATSFAQVTYMSSKTPATSLNSTDTTWWCQTAGGGGASGCTSSVTLNSVTLGTLDAYFNANLPAINLGAGGAGGVTGNLLNSSLQVQVANTVLGALTVATPSGLAMPSCSSSNQALIWTSGTGFGCNTIATSGSPGGTNGQLQYNNAGSFGGFTMGGDCTINPTTGNILCVSTNGNAFVASATTDTTNAANISSGALPTARLPAFGSGDVSFAVGGGAGTISANAVTNAKIAQMAANTVKGNFTAASANPADNAVPSCPDSGGNHLNYVSGTGLTCGATSSAATPVFFIGPTTAGSANAYTQAATTPSGFALTNGFVVRTAINIANTASSTLNVNTTGATTIDKQISSGVVPLAGGELQANHVYDFTYNTTCTCFVVTNTDGSAVSTGFTSATVTQTQWANWTVLAVKTAAQTVTLPSAATLAANGGIIVQAVGNSVTLTPQAADAINGGTLGASVTLASGGTFAVTTSGAAGATAFAETGGGGGGGTPGGSSGQVQYNNSGAFGGFTMSGDATLNTGTGALTVANNAITNAKAAQGGANTIKGNFTGSTANEADNAVPSCSGASQALNYTSGTGLGCATVGGINYLPGYVVSNWYLPLFPNDGLSTGQAPVIGTTYCFPGTLTQAVTIVALGTRIPTADAGGSVQLAVYNTGSWGRPSTPVINTASISTTTAGNIFNTFTNTSFSAGTYWFCTQTDNTTVRFLALSAGATSNIGAAQSIGNPSIAFVVNPQESGISITGTFGTWPTFTSGTTWTDTTTALVPIVGFEVASVP